MTILEFLIRRPGSNNFLALNLLVLNTRHKHPPKVRISLDPSLILTAFHH